MLFNEENASAKGFGGGAFQPSSSDAVLVAMMAARYKKQMENVKGSSEGNGGMDHPNDMTSKMVVYTSVEAHSCYLKAAILCQVTNSTNNHHHQPITYYPTGDTQGNPGGRALSDGHRRVGEADRA